MHKRTLFSIFWRQNHGDSYFFSALFLLGLVLGVDTSVPWGQIAVVQAHFSFAMRHDQPGLHLMTINTGGENVLVGQQIDYVLSLINDTTTTSVRAGDCITLIDKLPKGLWDISASGAGWRISISTTTSPATITALYTGHLPISPGGILPPVIVSGILISGVFRSLHNSATVQLSGSRHQAMIMDTSVSNLLVSAPDEIQPFVHLSSEPLKPAILPAQDGPPTSPEPFYPDLPHTGSNPRSAAS